MNLAQPGKAEERLRIESRASVSHPSGERREFMPPVACLNHPQFDVATIYSWTIHLCSRNLIIVQLYTSQPTPLLGTISSHELPCT